jgi:sugar phosphate isomerase/epimerase
MIGLSTVWTSPDARSGDEVLRPILDLGFAGIELEDRITRQIYHEILPRIRGDEIQVLSIHNYFPVPESIPPERASGDCFSLSSLDREERDQGVLYTSRTLEAAHELEAKAVVLHLGRVETTLPKDGLQQLYRQGRWNDEGQALLTREQEERGRHRAPHLDAVLFSLEQLSRRAERLGVTLGIENRFYLQEMPDKEEVGIILNQFRGAPLGYWHDTGHAAAFETLGICTHEGLLQRYAPSLVGVHLHDAQGLDDHKPPGQGQIDFAMVQKYLPDAAIKIMEIHQAAKGQEIRDALAFLHSKGIDC